MHDASSSTRPPGQIIDSRLPSGCLSLPLNRVACMEGSSLIHWNAFQERPLPHAPLSLLPSFRGREGGQPLLWPVAPPPAQKVRSRQQPPG